MYWLETEAGPPRGERQATNRLNTWDGFTVP